MASSEVAFHRRVQNRLADRYLDALEIKREPADEEEHSGHTETSKVHRPRGRFPGITIQNVIWLIASMAVFHLTEIHNVVMFDPRINRFWFNIGSGMVGVTVSVALFLIAWKSWVKKRSPDDWEKDHPAAIPVATASFIIGSFCLMKGFWPVWGLLTPFILVIMFMGFVVIVAMFG